MTAVVSNPDFIAHRSASISRRRMIVGSLLLVSAAVLPFAIVRPREFTSWDDVSNIVDNGAVRYLTATNVGWMFTHEIGANYIPLTWLSHAVDWIVWGDSAWGHGLTNALLHALCCLLLVACLRRGGLATPWAFLAGLLFAVHPIHTENVAWLSGRKDLLCSAALLAGQYCYMGWRTESRRSGWWGSLAWLLVAGLSKPMAMSAVAALWLYDAMWIGRTEDDDGRLRSRFAMRRATLSLLPHAILCIAIAGVAFLSQRGAMADESDRRWGSIDLVGSNLTLQMLRCWAPFPFSTFLPRSLLEALPAWLLWLMTAGLTAATIVIALRATTNRGWKGLAWWWFGGLAFLFPVSGVIPLGHTSIADRYLYLASVGPCVFVALGLAALARQASMVSRGIAFAAVLGLGLMTHGRALAWRDSFTLWSAAVEAFPHCGIAWCNLGYAFYYKRQMEEAAAVTRQGLEMAPDDPRVPVELASRLMDLQRLDEAEHVLTDADRRHPGYKDTIIQQGVLALRRGQLAEAKGFFDAASKRRPDWELPWLNLAYVFEAEDDLPAAIDASRHALKLDPVHRTGHGRLAELLIKDGRTDEALMALEQMNKAVPYAEEGWRRRINLLRRAGRLSDAERAADEAGRYIRADWSRY